MSEHRPWTANLAEAVWAATPAGRTALVDHRTGRSYAYSDLARATEYFAAALRSRMQSEGEAVALVCDNSAEYIAAYHGTLLAGGVVLPLEPLGTPQEWQPVLQRTGAKHLVAGAAAWRGLATTPAVESLGSTIVLDDAAATADHRVLSWQQWTSGTPDFHPPAAGGARPALLATSSGSLGLPKQVVLTHRNLLANLDQIAAVHRLNAADVVLGVTPFRHIYGMQMAMNPTLRVGGKLVVIGTPVSTDDLLEVIETHRITVAYLAPSVLNELARRDGTGGRDTTSLRLIYCGGAPLSPDAARTCAGLLGVPVVQGYGMTEAGCVFAPPDGARPDPASIGVALPHTEIRLADPATGAEGDTGEIWVRGPQVSPGFLGDDGTVHRLTDGEDWLHTGDIGRRGQDGQVTIVGRIKQLIKYKGHQIAPSELEFVLLDHPGVRDAVVVGVPDELAGELPVAFVVLKTPVDLEELTGFVAGRVAPYKKIRRITAVDTIPRSAMGKALIHELTAHRAEGEL